MPKKSYSVMQKYALASLLIGTTLTLLISVITKNTGMFKLWLVLQGLIVIVGFAIQGVQEIRGEVSNRKYLDTAITITWYMLLVLIGGAFEYLYLQVLFARGGPSPSIGFLIVILVSLLVALVLLSISLYLIRGMVGSLRRDWSTQRYAQAILKSLVYCIGAFLCLCGIYAVTSAVLLVH